MTIKTFRGLLADSAQDTVLLHTNNGATGYRIVKFEIIPRVPGTIIQETVCKIYKIEQTAVDGVIDFSDQTLVAAAYYASGEGSGLRGFDTTIIFDNEVFNQDIYITNKDVSGNTEPINYYIELEQVKLDLNENTVATLKDIRNLA